MKIIFWCLATLSLIDFWLTSLILDLGGEEVNPLIARSIESFGNLGIIYFKIPSLLALGVIVYFFWHQIRPNYQVIYQNIILITAFGYVAMNLYSLGLFISIANK